MTIQTNTTDRKALVKAIAEELQTEARYLRTPSYAYEIGDFTVDRDGNIIGQDFTVLRDFLLRNGYIAEDTPPADLETSSESDEPDESAADAPAVDLETSSENGAPDECTADSSANTETPTPAQSNIDEQTITIPAPGATVEQLRNLTYTIYSCQYILNLMTGGDTIAIPTALIDALKNVLPATLEEFTSLLDEYREQGLKGFDFRAGQFTLTFPFCETEPTKWTTFADLQNRILQMALAATRVAPEIIHPDSEAEKYTAHIWLQRLGYKGPEMKEQRNILLRNLHGYCAFSNGAKMQRHKDRYSAIRRERRDARRVEAVAAEETEPNTEKVDDHE